MEVKLWTDFSKRKNSTKQPLQSGYVTKQVTLKDNCSTSNPIFFLADTTIYSYLQWGDAYYFIDDVTLGINNTQYLTCSIDVLATWKNQILSTSAFVKYSSSNYNALIRDNRIIPLVDNNRLVAVEESGVFTTQNIDQGLVILGGVSEQEGIVNYVTDKEYIDAMMYVLFQDVGQDPDLLMSLAQQFGSVNSSLIFCKRYPIKLSATRHTELRDIYLGSYHPPGCVARILTNAHLSESIILEIPWQYSDFRRAEPYESMDLTLPFVGKVNLAIDDFLDARFVGVRMDANLTTGALTYTIRNGDTVVSVVNSSFGNDIPIATDQIPNSGNILQGLIGGSVGLGTSVADNNWNRGMGSMAAIASSAFHMAQTSVTVIGGYSGNYGEYANIDYRLEFRYHGTQTEPSNLVQLAGRPCMKVLSIGTLSGYVETLGFSIDIASTQKIRELINELMDSGVYLE